MPHGRRHIGADDAHDERADAPSAADEVAPAATDVRLSGLAERLALFAARAGKPAYEDLLDLLSRGLGDIGVPVSRAFVGIETLHPVHSGRTVTWSAGETDTRRRDRAEIADSTEYRDSPVSIVDETGRPYRVRLKDTDVAMPILADLKEAGDTDYVIHPLPFVDDTRTAVMSFATRDVVCHTGAGGVHGGRP